MIEALKLKTKDVPANLRGNYSGRKFRLYVTNEVVIPSDAGLWSGGSREVYKAIRLIDGKEIQLGSTSAPWNPNRVDQTVVLIPGIAVVMHSFFCGTDMGLSFYVHPDNVVKFIK